MANLIPGLLFITLFATEGIGLTVERWIFFTLYLIVPAAVYLSIAFSRQKIRLPPLLAFFVMLFLLFSNLSSFVFSLDKQASAQYFLYFLTLSFLFVYGYNFKDTVSRLLIVAIPALGGFFLVYSLLVHRAIFEKQLVYPTYGSHNHLGDFLGLAIILLFSLRTSGWRAVLQKIAISAFFAALVFSFSRSAYAALSATAIIALIGARHHLPRRALYAVAAAVAILITSVVITSSVRLQGIPLLASAQRAVIKRLGLIPRDLLSDRDLFARQAIASMARSPWFGVGGGNFIITSSLHGTTEITDSAHNVILELAVEQGIPATVVFLIVLTITIASALKSKGVWGFALIYLLINFLTDYTYQILLFPVITVLIAGIAYDEKEQIRFPGWLYGFGSILLLIAATCILYSQYLLKNGRFNEALLWYPLNKKASIAAINAQTEIKSSESLAEQSALMIAPEDPGILLAIARSAENHDQKRKALDYYDHMYRNNHQLSFAIIKRMYSLKKQLVSPHEADAFLVRVLRDYMFFYGPRETFQKEVAGFCDENKSMSCHVSGWD